MPANKSFFNTWLLLSIAGIILSVIGVSALVNPLYTYVMLARYAGVGLLINGILRAVISFTNARYLKENNWLRAESLVDFLFGIILLLNPLFSFIVFPLLIGPWMLCVGILKIAASLALRKTIRKWVFILTVGIISIVFGLVIIYDPFPRADGITILIGAFGLMMGTLYIFDSLRFRKMEDTLNMIF